MAARKAAKRTARKTVKKAPARSKAEPAKGLSMGSVSPAFTANDLEQSLAWYRDVLGFVVEDRWEQDGKLTGVQLRAGSVTFMLGQDDWKRGRDRKKGEGFRIYCTTTQDVDALAEKIKSKGGILDHLPQDQPWGTREFALTDPDGFKITIAKETKRP